MKDPQIVRVQDPEGRGPYRPGFSDSWVSASRVTFFPPIFSELGPPRFKRIVDDAHKRGLHIGCAVSFRRLPEWFNQEERAKLMDLGFMLVSADDCEQLATTQTQRLIGSPNPLRYLPWIEWPEHRARTAA